MKINFKMKNLIHTRFEYVLVWKIDNKFDSYHRPHFSAEMFHSDNNFLQSQNSIIWTRFPEWAILNFYFKAIIINVQ